MESLKKLYINTFIDNSYYGNMYVPINTYIVKKDNFILRY